ncbi:hypothetical protein HZA73_03220 [candidate division TA06 bacterium]|nr:hypothetical protein [candidate division TA06 bacterium]
MKKNLFLIPVLLLWAHLAQAQLIFWNMPASAEQVIFGQGYLVQSEAPQGLMQNPAALGFIRYRNFSASGIQWWQDVYGCSAGYTQPAGKSGTFAVNMSYWSLGTVTEISDGGQPLGTIQSQSVNAGLGYGLVVYQTWGLGLDVKASRLNLPGRYDWGWSSDLAVSYKRDRYTGSILIRDLGPDYPRNNEIRYPLNTLYIVGLKAVFMKGKLSGSLQYNLPNDGRSYPSLSLEIAPTPAFSLKLGYENDPASEERSPLGLGLEVKKLGRTDLSVIYGYRSYGVLGNIQALTMGIDF